MTVKHMKKNASNLWELWEHKCSSLLEEFVVWVAWSLWCWDCDVWTEDFKTFRFA